MILHQISSRLATVFQRHCKNPQAASAEAEDIIDDLFKALGACEVCYGAGYTLVDEYELCTCERGRALRGFVKHYVASDRPS